MRLKRVVAASLVISMLFSQGVMANESIVESESLDNTTDYIVGEVEDERNHR